MYRSASNLIHVLHPSVAANHEDYASRSTAEHEQVRWDFV